MSGEETYLNGHLSDYSEDFEEDEETVPAARGRASLPPVPVKLTPSPLRKQSPRVHGGVGAGKAAKSTPRGRKSLPARRQNLVKTGAFSDSKRLSKGGKPKPYIKTYSHGVFSPRDRVLSANQHTIKKLQNELISSKRELEETRKENRLLNRLQARQEREWNRLHSQEGELPQILARHAEEIRGMKEQLHRSQEAARTNHQRANELHHDLLKLSERKKKLEGVVRKKHLLEREALTVELLEKNDKLDEKNRRILELERSAEMTNKTHTQEVRQLRQKNKLLSLEADGLRNATHRMQSQLKEKDKVMDVMNIYSQRIMRPVNQRATTEPYRVDSTPSQTEITCPPFKAVTFQSKPAMRATGSQTELESPRRPTKHATILVASGTQTDTDTDIEDQETSPGRKPGNFESSSVPRGTDSPLRSSQEASKSLTQETPKPPLPLTRLSEPVRLPGTSQANGADVPVPVERERHLPEGARERKQEEDKEKQKKEALLARLRALDGQKDPPGSQPITLPRSTLEQAPDVTTAMNQSMPVALVDATRTGPAARMSQTPAVAPIAAVGTGPRPATKTLETPARKPQPNPPPPPPPQGQGASGKTESDLEAQRRKKLLLAKLMAIDEGGDPSKVVLKPSMSEVGQPPQKHEPKKTSTGAGGQTASASRSNTSIQSWPDTVENMHQGKPAFSTEDDPFGKQFSRTSLGAASSSRKGSGSVRQEGAGMTFITDGSLGEGRPRRVQLSRRQAAGNAGGLVGADSGPGRPSEEIRRQEPTEGRGSGGSYRPTFGRRAQPKAAQNEPIFGGLDRDNERKGATRPRDATQEHSIERDFPWNSNPARSTPHSMADRHTSGPRSLQNRASGSQSKAPLLPLRPKAEAGFELMPGAIVSEPDDMEEIVL